MDLKELKALISQGEGQKLEFKHKSNHPERIVRELVAFANTDGGILIIGVADNKTLVGLQYPDEDEYLLTKSIEKHITPPIEYKIERIRIEGEREVLCFLVDPSNLAPHFLCIDDEKKVFVRHADKALQASKEMREILKGKSKGKNYTFEYGDKETKLVKYLDVNHSVTISSFMEAAQISSKTASRTLVLLVLSGLLKIIPHEHADLYVLR